jgi:signal transduction protein with GAF and PtsI domain
MSSARPTPPSIQRTPPSANQSASTRIRRGQSATAAVRETTRELIARFEAMDDAYLQARAEDIRAVGRRILLHLCGHADALGEVPEQAILLGQGRGLICITGVPAERLAGLVCTGGSPLSHGAIVARALGIPAIIVPVQSPRPF